MLTLAVSVLTLTVDQQHPSRGSLEDSVVDHEQTFGAALVHVGSALVAVRRHLTVELLDWKTSRHKETTAVSFGALTQFGFQPQGAVTGSVLINTELKSNDNQVGTHRH